ncbi:MAG: hypothetical protein ACFE8O_03370 [Candidatus Hermodarchaeota archaeon]
MLKTKKLLLGVIGCCLLLLFAVHTPNSKASGAWSDDFDDSDYDGWTIGDGSFSAADNCLEATGADWSAIEHESTVAYGNWSFWFYSNDSISSGQNRLRIYLMADDILSQSSTTDIPMTNGYAIKIDPDAFGSNIAFWVYRYVAGVEREITPIFVVSPDFVVYGWYHIEITRDCTGNFTLYGNDTLYFHFTETTHISSSLFGFASEQGQAFDNVEISDTPCGGIPLEIIVIVAGVAVAVIVIVIIVVFVYRRRTP